MPASAEISPRQMSAVGEYSGPNMLDLSITAYDPERRFTTVNWCAAKGSIALGVSCPEQSEIRRTEFMEYLDGQSHSGLMLFARITLPHFSVSSAMNLPKSAGEPGNTVLPRSASRALILGSARPALISLLSLSTI